ncbi:MAG: hypothetical protein EOP04_18270 [Proteobacteria bacterium]|nr:MAG: hypothetical protein EOP04_18270 [Pseudomonadota bacterium]
MTSLEGSVCFREHLIRWLYETGGTSWDGVGKVKPVCINELIENFRKRIAPFDMIRNHHHAHRFEPQKIKKADTVPSGTLEDAKALIDYVEGILVNLWLAVTLQNRSITTQDILNKGSIRDFVDMIMCVVNSV